MPNSSPCAVGIDLGTTNSLVAIAQAGVVRVLPTPEGSGLLPSIVSFISDRPRVGQLARADLLAGLRPVIVSSKRLMGRQLREIGQLVHHLPYALREYDGELQIGIGDSRWVTPLEIAVMILRELKRMAETALTTEVNQAVITVPAYFNDAQRQATRTAGRLAGV